MKKITFGNDKNIINKKLKSIRIKRNLTQYELAAKMQTLDSKIENNARIVTDYELACFCRVLDVDVNEMLKDFYDNLKMKH